ncbi:tRNA 5-methylaminomethyl-2-thiouridine biosynthesis bifunctional protein MnmC [Ferrovum sp. JA12]|uniref:FAD-dependent 5-carboxymethylaminomethyl-2-thiouridine(34) oxidoreductase MnmC n=1 Tax=Ferrovum sp. JA12 TaxID=1356299 RepID=UPI0007024D43|nr:FAD-dependent 5-carboxymethylaminomethyl-2-thiouridine(34) oxidoreductase MnmC [Ferrovum sp. JA12]KRH78906.1 tRNA 5-methylaminomethyl-2-thiouridine biosynthesis bifunctional protein MnmC [Ferrovum sp. JA12]
MAIIKHPEIILLNDTLFSTEFNDVYHSAWGGAEQAYTVFIQGNHLQQRFTQVNHQFCLVETGFGIGINFLATAQVWLEHNRHPNTWLHYVACEKYPITPTQLQDILPRYHFPTSLVNQLIKEWPTLTPGYHEILFPQERICLTLIIDDIDAAVKSLTMTIDALYLDGFSPKKNPDMWRAEIFSSLAQHCHVDTTLATWCVAGEVRNNLMRAGFNVSREKGFAQKKHRLVGQFNRIPVDKQTLRQNRFFPHVRTYLSGQQTKRVAVIGSGIAGSLMTYQLCQRGMQVSLFEKDEAIANQASGNPAAIVRPVISKDDNVLSRVTRRGFYLTKQLITEIEGASPAPIAYYPGVVHLAKNQEEALAQREALHQLGLPRDYAYFIEGKELLSRFHVNQPLGGLFFPQAGYVNPKLLCERAIALCTSSVSLHLNTAVTHLQKQPGHWLLFNPKKECLGEFDAVVLAIGAESLEQTSALGLTTNRGQLSLFCHENIDSTLPVMCQDGYLISLPGQQLLSGATYEHELDKTPWLSSHLQNTQRIASILGDSPQSVTSLLDRVAFRCVSRDRLPVTGELEPRLYCILGNASRGVVWSALNARIIRSLMTGEPMPIEKQLLDRLSPKRFLMGRL